MFNSSCKENEKKRFHKKHPDLRKEFVSFSPQIDYDFPSPSFFEQSRLVLLPFENAGNRDYLVEEEWTIRRKDNPDLFIVHRRGPTVLKKSETAADSEIRDTPRTEAGFGEQAEMPSPPEMAEEIFHAK